MSLIDELGARFSGAELQRVEIPEWGTDGDPFIAYFKPWTLHDERQIKNFIGDDNPEGFAAVVANKLVDGDGANLFAKGDRLRLLRNCEAHTMKRIATEIMTSTISIEDAAGN